MSQTGDYGSNQPEVVYADPAERFEHPRCGTMNHSSASFAYAEQLLRRPWPHKTTFFRVRVNKSPPATEVRSGWKFADRHMDGGRTTYKGCHKWEDPVGTDAW